MVYSGVCGFLNVETVLVVRLVWVSCVVLELERLFRFVERLRRYYFVFLGVFSGVLFLVWDMFSFCRRVFLGNIFDILEEDEFLVFG